MELGYFWTKFKFINRIVMFNTHIETERLLLRPFTVDDIQASYELNADPLVVRYTNDGGVKTLEQMDYIIKNTVLKDYTTYNYGRFAVCLKSNNEFIGFSGLKYLDDYKEVDLGYRFKRVHWGKGYATESSIASLDFGFNVLHLEEIVGFALPENTASIRVLEKLNFQYESQFYEEEVLINKYKLKRP